MPPAHLGALETRATATTTTLNTRLTPPALFALSAALNTTQTQPESPSAAAPTAVVSHWTGASTRQKYRGPFRPHSYQFHSDTLLPVRPVSTLRIYSQLSPLTEPAHAHNISPTSPLLKLGHNIRFYNSDISKRNTIAVAHDGPARLQSIWEQPQRG
ncbi:hypothetical protein CDV36_007794 [Fusarium kuroshium]|uniref:Uncharacterized protein n=1 Tax=Fusarium kuroshium TaxID=2010991 RepID=A0A3M2S5I4_9HYPO|nr:hypothetical protein CDV36_007794 [Fusarium kuroshium]